MREKNNHGPWKWVLITAVSLFLLVMLVLPLVYVIVTALRNGLGAYLAAVTDPYAVKAILLTIQVTVIAVVVNTVFGLFASWPHG